MNHLFWLSTLIPGFAILQAARPVDLRYGLLATIAWSFGLTVALASPIIVVAHVLELTAPTVALLAALFGAGGTTTVTEVPALFWSTTGAVVPAMLTDRPRKKPVPPSTTVPPPLMLPREGATLVMVGATMVYVKALESSSTWSSPLVSTTSTAPTV